MTNRSKGKKGKKSLKLLDLSFEGQTVEIPQTTGGKFRSKVVTQNVGAYRPHGGYRGTKSHPLSPYSFNKSMLNNQHQHHADADDNLTNDLLSRPPSASPGWAIEVSSEPNHSGESPLFVHNFLAPSRVEQKSDPGNHLKSMINGRQRPLSANDAGRFYRPNSTHQYLTTTELKNASKSEIDVRLGKPTRTTLLRARQKCNSAPQNAYNHRRELLKQAEQRMETRRSLTPSYSLQELIGLDLSSDESLHSFLIGARYNRAHFLDSRSLVTHGVYMPRGNPQGCFILKSNKYGDQDEPPPAPPESPADSDSDVDPCSSHIEPQYPRSPVPPPQRPSSPSLQDAPPPPLPGPLEIPQQAWEGGTVPAGATGPSGDSPGPAEPPEQISPGADGDETTAHLEDNKPILERLIALDEALNVKGRSLNSNTPAPSPRHRIVRSASAHSNHGNSASSTAPSVVSILPTITGTSINLTGKPGENPTPSINQPTPTVVTRKASSRGSHHTEDTKDKAPLPENLPKVMEDKSFNVPSVAGDSEPPDVNLDEEVQVVTTTHPQTEAEPTAEVTEDKTEEVMQDESLPAAVDDGIRTTQTTEVQTPDAAQQRDAPEDEGAARSIQSAKGRRSRVRFADEVADLEHAQEVGHQAAEQEVTGQEVNPAEGREDNVVFFLTEEEAEKANPDPGTTDPGTSDPDTADPGTADPGTADPGTADPGTTDPGTADPGTAAEKTDVTECDDGQAASVTDQTSDTSVDEATDQESTNPADNIRVVFNKKVHLDPDTETTAKAKEDNTESESGENPQTQAPTNSDQNTVVPADSAEKKPDGSTEDADQ